MNVEVNVKIDLSDRVYGLVARMCEQVEELKSMKVPASRKRSSRGAASADVPAVEADKAAVTDVADKAAVADAPAPAKAAAADKAAEADVAKEVSAEDVRAAMVACRKRVMGEDWDNPESEVYRLYHRSLVAMFKATAALHGAAKPSLLSPDGRAGFVEDCGRIRVTEGRLDPGQDAPF